MRERIVAHRDPWSRTIALRFGIERVDGGYDAAQPLTFQATKPCEVIQPFLSLEPKTAQSLMDELWNCGIRPTEGTGSAGAMAATERHLKDLQSIVFKNRK